MRWPTSPFPYSNYILLNSEIEYNQVENDTLLFKCGCVRLATDHSRRFSRSSGACAHTNLQNVHLHHSSSYDEPHICYHLYML